MEKSIYIMLLAVTLFTACKSNNSNVDTQAEADKIRELENQWTAALQTRDLEKTMSFYATDAVSMPSDDAITSGIDSIRKKQEAAFADTTMLWDKFSWTNESVEVSSSGDLAYVRGSSKFAIKTAVGIVEGTGKGIDIWKKTDGEWKAVATTGNNDKLLTVMRSSPELVEEFSKKEIAWSEAIIKGDVKAMDLMLATEYIEIGENGPINKEQLIKDVTTNNFKVLAPYAMSDVKVNIYGNMAVAKGIITMKATDNGKDASGSFWYADIFIQRDGRWQSIFSQSTKKK